MAEPKPTEPVIDNAQAAAEKAVSPRWTKNTKLAVSFAGILIVFGIIIKFQNYLSLILTAFLIVFLFTPIITLIQKHLKLSWRLATTLVYVLMALIMLGLLTWGGITLFGQLQNLIDLLTTALKNLVANLEKLSNQEVVLGPFNFFVPELTATYLSNLLVEQVQPILGQAGSLVGKALSGGANLIFRLFMMYLISYFFTSETDSVKGQKISFNLPGYENDVQQMGKEINNIWNAFIRGEFLVVGTAIFIYSILLSGLQMPYSLGLALIAGLGRFIPYVGAWVSWLTFAIVALITRPTPFGALPLVYTAIVVGVALVVDNILDNVMTPKVMGNALKVHPAAVLISALIGSQLIGIIGIILAAPVFATVKLVTHYVFHKLTDQDPWEGISYSSQRKELALTRFFRYLKKKLPLWSKQARVKVAEGWRKVFKRGAGSSGGPVQHP